MTRIQELEGSITAVEAAVEAGEIGADTPFVARMLERWRAELRQFRAYEAEEQRRRESAHAEAGVIRHGVKRYADDDSYTWWCVIRRGTVGWWPVLEQRLGVAMQPTRCHVGDYDCCGRFFSRGARVR